MNTTIDPADRPADATQPAAAAPALQRPRPAQAPQLPALPQA